MLLEERESLRGMRVNMEEKERVEVHMRDYPAKETVGTQNDAFTPHFDRQIDRVGWQDPNGTTCQVKGCWVSGDDEAEGTEMGDARSGLRGSTHGLGRGAGRWYGRAKEEG
ncbi:hypothetical protein L3X38_000442 [Prunus dulcis]|uniref:Uncharacterized protein n=1 Tax=Prunus dulcis TaxID=3755 RepID=A0AAD4WQ46_PRUDU|nr:hypothetical protein L3X38_000442 [Prunus dulcis]